ncbi:rRNA-processing protein las1 [Malassezia caprae]|uniref:rRNA-processing protein las1 n=1 Tax=Malassezia caprae TaxID=1381934 RepID=A0AAF0E881_9BASI|nr:rRNA-processing protein las1 [Malassezia caprae]
MRLPRRTPYYDGAARELAFVHAQLYGDRRDIKAIESALAIVRLWLHRGACPQAVEATALLMQCVCLDATHAPELAVRTTYAMALTRFVNSVVDSFQTGMYAQSIGAIAERIGLPLWLVQVRHSATHEELPSLDVAREACDAALRWLDEHYWQPTVHPRTEAPAPDDTEARKAASLQAAQLLYAYRHHMQALQRDVSLAQLQHPPHEKAMNEVVAWVEAEHARRLALPAQGDTAARLNRQWHMDEEAPVDEAARLSLASVLVLLAAELCVPGALLPSKQRHAVPSEWLAVWTPLLLHVQRTHPLFLPLLADALTHVDEAHAPAARAWLTALAALDTGTVPSDAPRWPSDASLEARSAHEHVAAPVPLWRLIAQYALERSDAAWHELAASVAAEHDSDLSQRIEELRAVRATRAHSSETADACVAAMEARAALALEPAPAPAAPAAPHAADSPAAPPGWHLAPAPYIPTPIGCLAGTRPSLLLE